MSWQDIDKATPNKDQASKAKAEVKAKEADLAKAYAHCFSTNFGQQVLNDISQRFIYNNDTDFNSNNVNYEAAYHNGESGVVKFIIHQMQRAEKI